VRQAVLRVFEPSRHQRLAAFYLPAPGAEFPPLICANACAASCLLHDPAAIHCGGANAAHPQWKDRPQGIGLPAAPGGASGERVAPRTPTERFLADLWADLTGSKVESIGANDNFFDVGAIPCWHCRPSRAFRPARVLLEARSMFLNSLNQNRGKLVAHSEGSKLSSAAQAECGRSAGERLTWKSTQFGEPPRFGLYHPANGEGSRGRGVLICPPIAHSTSAPIGRCALGVQLAARASMCCASTTLPWGFGGRQ